MCNYSITLNKDEKILIILISSFHWCDDRDTSIIDFNFQHKNCQENQVIINTIQLHFRSFKDNLLLFNLFRNVFEMMARLLFVYVYYVWMWLSVYISFLWVYSTTNQIGSIRTPLCTENFMASWNIMMTLLSLSQCICIYSKGIGQKSFLGFVVGNFDKRMLLQRFAQNDGKFLFFFHPVQWNRI